MLIIDEAQNLPLPVLEQIRILSNLETDKEKLLQIILVGQLNLGTLLRSPEVRQLDQRVSIRYQLEPLDAEAVAAYVAHRLTIAGGSASVVVHGAGARRGASAVGRHSAPHQPDVRPRAARRLFDPHEPHHAGDGDHAAKSLDLQSPVAARRFGLPRMTWRASLVASAAVAVLASAIAVTATTILYQRLGQRVVACAGRSERAVHACAAAVETRPIADVTPAQDPLTPSAEPVDRQLPV